MQVIFIDYPDGAGGEFLSYTLSKHQGFYSPKIEESDLLQVTHDDITGVLNRTSVEKSNDWQYIAESVFIKLKEKINELNSHYSNIAIPYHCCYHNHYKLIKSIFPNSIIVSIRPTTHKDWQLVHKEILRKVHLVKCDLARIKYFYQIYDINKDIKINLANFLNFDVHLLRNNLPIVSSNRYQLVQMILEKNITEWKQSDILIDWWKLFGDIDNIKSEYIVLCQNLNLLPDDSIAEYILDRNKRNFKELLKFDLESKLKEFNIINENNLYVNLNSK